MMSQGSLKPQLLELNKQLIAWHKDNLGHFRGPRGHALRLLHEVIELCIADGASQEDLATVFRSEVRKAIDKKELPDDFSEPGPQRSDEEIAEEWADCYILFEVLRHGHKIPAYKVVSQKLEILKQRKWAVDEEGVLWRPSNERK